MSRQIERDVVKAREMWPAFEAFNVPPPPKEWLDKLCQGYEEARVGRDTALAKRFVAFFESVVQMCRRVESGDYVYQADRHGEIYRSLSPGARLMRRRTLEPTAETGEAVIHRLHLPRADSPRLREA